MIVKMPGGAICGRDLMFDQGGYCAFFKTAQGWIYKDTSIEVGYIAVCDRLDGSGEIVVDRSGRVIREGQVWEDPVNCCRSD
jgi:hypothetical protein